jgi:PIN domain nuclease of toxin-antitoxin system
VSDATSVLDASALLAFIFDEPGADIVEHALADAAVISAVNWAEALTKIAEIDQPAAMIAEQLTTLLGDALVIEPLTTADGPAIARLRLLTRDAGLSLGERSCLALAQRLGVPAVTTDRAWTQLGAHIGIAVQLARP